MNKLADAIKYGVIAVVLLVFLSFGIGTNVTMPQYATVYLEPQTKTYIGLPCLKEWERRHGGNLPIAALGTITEARQMKYAPDDNCRNTGAFAPDGPALPIALLIKAGLLPEPKYWWDQPYRLDTGEIIRPGQKTRP